MHTRTTSAHTDATEHGSPDPPVPLVPLTPTSQKPLLLPTPTSEKPPSTLTTPGRVRVTSGDETPPPPVPAVGIGAEAKVYEPKDIEHASAHRVSFERHPRRISYEAAASATSPLDRELPLDLALPSALDLQSDQEVLGFLSADVFRKFLQDPQCIRAFIKFLQVDRNIDLLNFWHRVNKITTTQHALRGLVADTYQKFVVRVDGDEAGLGLGGVFGEAAREELARVPGVLEGLGSNVWLRAQEDVFRKMYKRRF
ncbi:hypothetical protein HDU96_003593, partial [Phlyctochytrium bullatum]